jgi:hypothetical protein
MNGRQAPRVIQITGLSIKGGFIIVVNIRLSKNIHKESLIVEGAFILRDRRAGKEATYVYYL